MSRSGLLLPGRFCAGLFALLPWFGAHQTAEEAVLAGNTFYEQENYPAALERYSAAADLLPDSVEIVFNKAAVASQQDQNDAAVEGYMVVLGTGDEQLRSRAKYNIGVIKLRQAQEAERGLTEASSLAQGAARSFREALELERHFEDARYNLEVAIRIAHEIDKRLADQRRRDTKSEDDTSLKRGAPLQDLIKNQGMGQQKAQPDQTQPNDERQTDQTPQNFSASEKRERAGDSSLPVAMDAQAAAQLMERLLQQMRNSEAWLQDRKRAALQAPGEHEPW